MPVGFEALAAQTTLELAIIDTGPWRRLRWIYALRGVRSGAGADYHLPVARQRL